MEEKKTDKRHDFGRHCEFMARTYLEQQGYLILETNWRSGHKEIDIIAKEKMTAHSRCVDRSKDENLSGNRRSRFYRFQLYPLYV